MFRYGSIPSSKTSSEVFYLGAFLIRYMLCSCTLHFIVRRCEQCPWYSQQLSQSESHSKRVLKDMSITAILLDSSNVAWVSSIWNSPIHNYFLGNHLNFFPILNLTQLTRWQKSFKIKKELHEAWTHNYWSSVRHHNHYTKESTVSGRHRKAFSIIQLETLTFSAWLILVDSIKRI